MRSFILALGALCAAATAHAQQQTITVPVTIPVIQGPAGPPGPQGPAGPPGPAGLSSRSGGTLLPGGRLTLTSGAPVMSGDTTSATLYYTPFRPTGFPAKEIALSLSGLAGGAAYDVDTDGVSLCLVPWSGSTPPMTQCAQYFVGAILTDAKGGTVSCTLNYGQNRICGAWTAETGASVQVEMHMHAGDPGGPRLAGCSGSAPRYCYVPASTLGPSEGTAANRATVFVGAAEQWITFQYRASWFLNQDQGPSAYIFGIGWNSTTALCTPQTGPQGGPEGSENIDIPTSNFAKGTGSGVVECDVPPFVGAGTAYMLEEGRADASAFFGPVGQMLTARWRG